MAEEKEASLLNAIKRYRIRIVSGNHKGRYVGLQFGGGMMTNPEMRRNPPVNVPGYGLHAQEAAATQFFEGKTGKVETELRALGYSTELVKVE